MITPLCTCAAGKCVSPEKPIDGVTAVSSSWTAFRHRHAVALATCRKAQFQFKETCL